MTVYAALASGRAHLVYGDSEPARGIRFWAAGSGALASVGEPIDDQPDLCLYASSPEPRTLFRLYRDGRMLAQQVGRLAKFLAPEPGAYRLEVYRWRCRIGPLCLGVDPWLFTNCIRVLPRSGGESPVVVSDGNQNPVGEGST